MREAVCVWKPSGGLSFAACGRARRSAETGNVKCLAMGISNLYMVQFECCLDPLCTSLVSCRLHSLCTCALVLGWGGRGRTATRRHSSDSRVLEPDAEAGILFSFRTFTFFFFSPDYYLLIFTERDPRNSASA